MACSKSAISISTNDFTLDLYKRLVAAGQSINVLMSPMSIMVVMAMLHIGARNNTEKQLINGLRLGAMDKTALAKEMETFVARLKESTKAVNIQTAYRLFTHTSKVISGDFIRTIIKYFNSDVQALYLVTKAAESREEINKWVEEETNDKIKHILPAVNIPDFTALVGVDALYFKGCWKRMFEEKATAEADFHVSSKETVKVQMMKETLMNVKYSQRKDLGCRIIEMPFEGGEVGMVILLPDLVDGLSELENRITPRELEVIMDMMSNDEITVQIPKFKLDASHQLKDVLSALGMSDLCDDKNADLSGIGQDLYVFNVFHKAILEINEEGTDAPESGDQCLSTAPPFIADHPFMFIIWDHKLGVSLLVGRLVNPKA